jgi:CRAL/TRIO domain
MACAILLPKTKSTVSDCSSCRCDDSTLIVPTSGKCHPYEKFPDDVAFMLHQLSEDEKEVAARTSYTYVKEPLEERKSIFAEAMAERYLASKSDKTKALAKMKSTLEFRKDLDIDALRDAPLNPTSPLQKPLRKFLSNKKLYVSGYDKDGRSTYIFVPRLVEDHCPQWTVKGHVYSMERAIACSKASDKMVNAVVDFNGFSFLRNTPPAAVGKEIMLILRNHYVGHIHQIFIIDAPAAFLCIWKLFEPFAGRNTRTKIKFVNSDAQKEQVIGRLYSKEEAASWMLPGGLKNRRLDVDGYLFQTPFDSSFDE